MAGLLLCVMGALLSGCLIPQEDTVPFDQPMKRNSPLRIVDQSPPTQRTTYHPSTMCTDLNPNFTVTVVDEDTGDVIESRWFIDQGPNTLPFQTTPLPPNGSAQRDLSAPRGLTFTNALANLSIGIHLLTVYVADSTFGEFDGEIRVSPRNVTLPNGSTVSDPGYFDSYTWVLDVERCP